jgi:hypothetical protein
MHPATTAGVLPPVTLGSPPADIPFSLAGYTDVAPGDFAYARTPGGNWIAAAADETGRVYVIDQAGDLYYDSGDPALGVIAVRCKGFEWISQGIHSRLHMR